MCIFGTHAHFITVAILALDTIHHILSGVGSVAVFNWKGKGAERTKLGSL